MWCRVATILLDERCHCCHDDIEAVQRAVQRLVCRQRVLLSVVTRHESHDVRVSLSHALWCQYWMFLVAASTQHAARCGVFTILREDSVPKHLGLAVVDKARAKFFDLDMARRKAHETRSLQPPRSLRQQLAPHIHVQLLSQQLRCAPYDILPKLKAALHLQPALQRPRLRLPRHHCDRYRRQPRPRQVHYPQLPHALHLHPPTAAQALRA